MKKKTSKTENGVTWPTGLWRIPSGAPRAVSLGTAASGPPLAWASLWADPVVASVLSALRHDAARHPAAACLDHPTGWLALGAAVRAVLREGPAWWQQPHAERVAQVGAPQWWRTVLSGWSRVTADWRVADTRWGTGRDGEGPTSGAALPEATARALLEAIEAAAMSMTLSMTLSMALHGALPVSSRRGAPEVSGAKKTAGEQTAGEKTAAEAARLGKPGKGKRKRRRERAQDARLALQVNSPGALRAETPVGESPVSEGEQIDKRGKIEIASSGPTSTPLPTPLSTPLLASRPLPTGSLLHQVRPVPGDAVQTAAISLGSDQYLSGDRHSGQVPGRPLPEKALPEKQRRAWGAPVGSPMGAVAQMVASLLYRRAWHRLGPRRQQRVWEVVVAVTAVPVAQRGAALRVAHARLRRPAHAPAVWQAATAVIAMVPPWGAATREDTPAREVEQRSFYKGLCATNHHPTSLWATNHHPAVWDQAGGDQAGGDQISEHAAGEHAAVSRDEGEPVCITSLGFSSAATPPAGARGWQS
jgi:hypothetical protein